MAHALPLEDCPKVHTLSFILGFS